MSNVVQELWVKNYGPQVFLTRLGLFGSAVSFTQAVIFERHALSNTHWTSAAIGAWVGYSASLTSLYYLTSWFLVNADAALFNLSLLTSDVYAVLFSKATIRVRSCARILRP